MSRQVDTHIMKLAAQWLPGASLKLTRQADGGKNNTTRIVEADGRRYVLRIYETHRDEAKLRFEHAVLLALAEFGRELPLRTPELLRTPEPLRTLEPQRTSEPQRTPELQCTPEPQRTPELQCTPEPQRTPELLRTPEPLRTSEPQRTPEPERTLEPQRTQEPLRTLEPQRTQDLLRTPEPQRTPDGRTIVRIGGSGPDAGKLAALFGYLPGTNPALDSERQLESLGRTAGLLGHLLERVRPKLPQELSPAYRPYYEIEHTHPLCPPERVEAFCAEPPAPFGELAEELRIILGAYRRLRERLPALRQLPHQLVHGDLNASNVLAEHEGGDITAVLDFEFVTLDLRVMELAVCLSDILQPEAEPAALWSRADALLRGYGSAGPRLAAAELDALPLLVELRRLDVFVHFLGRYWDEVDPAAALGDFVRSAAAHIRWLGEHAGQLRELCRRRLAEGGT